MSYHCEAHSYATGVGLTNIYITSVRLTLELPVIVAKWHSKGWFRIRGLGFRFRVSARVRVKWTGVEGEMGNGL